VNSDYQQNAGTISQTTSGVTVWFLTRLKASAKKSAKLRAIVVVQVSLVKLSASGTPIKGVSCVRTESGSDRIRRSLSSPARLLDPVATALGSDPMPDI
jgi:hypothetical protein